MCALFGYSVGGTVVTFFQLDYLVVVSFLVLRWHKTIIVCSHNFAACCKNWGILLLQDNFSKLVYIRYHSFVHRREQNTSFDTYVSFRPICQLWCFLLFIFLEQIGLCSLGVSFCKCAALLFLLVQQIELISFCFDVILLSLFSTGNASPQIIRPHTYTKCWFCITASNSQLFSMDVSSDLHVNDRKHDMQRNSKQTLTHHTLRMVLNAREENRSWCSTTEFDGNHVWAVRKIKMSGKKGQRVSCGAAWKIPTQKSTQSNSIWLLERERESVCVCAITNKHTHTSTRNY